MLHLADRFVAIWTDGCRYKCRQQGPNVWARTGYFVANEKVRLPHSNTYVRLALTSAKNVFATPLRVSILTFAKESQALQSQTSSSLQVRTLVENEKITSSRICHGNFTTLGSSEKAPNSPHVTVESTRQAHLRHDTNGKLWSFMLGGWGGFIGRCSILRDSITIPVLPLFINKEQHMSEAGTVRSDRDRYSANNGNQSLDIMERTSCRSGHALL